MRRNFPSAGTHRFWLALFFAGVVPVSADPGLAGAEELYRRGKQAVLAGEYITATNLLEQAVAGAPRESNYHHWLGNAQAWLAAGAPLGDKPALGRKCLAAYLRAIELDPDNLPARFSLMNFHRRVPFLLGGGLTRASGQAEEIGRRDPVQGAYARAVLLGDDKKYAEALGLLADVLRQRPAYYAANLALGRLALESGQRLAEGAAALRRCLELTPSENDENREAVTRCLSQLTPRLSTRDTVATAP